jgi:hypothetical protein
MASKTSKKSARVAEKVDERRESTTPRLTRYGRGWARMAANGSFSYQAPPRATVRSRRAPPRGDRARR